MLLVHCQQNYVGGFVWMMYTFSKVIVTRFNCIFSIPQRDDVWDGWARCSWCHHWRLRMCWSFICYIWFTCQVRDWYCCKWNLRSYLVALNDTNLFLTVVVLLILRLQMKSCLKLIFLKYFQRQICSNIHSFYGHYISAVVV